MLINTNNHDFNTSAPSGSRGSLADMIKEAFIQAECDADFYLNLSESLDDPFDNKLADNIRLDKIKLALYLEELYFLSSLGKYEKKAQSTGQLSRIGLMQSLKEKMFDELENIEFLRKIYTALSSQSSRDILFEVIIDGQIHAQWLSYLYNKYSC